MDKLEQYHMTLHFSEDDGEWIARCNEYTGLSFLHEDPIEALKGFISLLEAVKELKESEKKEELFKKVPIDPINLLTPLDTKKK